MHDPLPDCCNGRLRAVLNLKFGEKRFQVRLHSIFADEERSADFLVTASLGQQLQHVHFALRKVGAFLPQSKTLGHLNRERMLPRKDRPYGGR
jgi:hypothetical protein